MWLAVGLFVVLVLARGASHAPYRTVATSGGTPVCGTLPSGETVWTAAGGPYLICASGVTVPSGATLTLSQLGGGFRVEATGAGGLVSRGTLRTLAGPVSARVTFDRPATTAGSWAGLSAEAGSVSLAHVDVAHAVDGVRVAGVVDPLLTDLTVQSVSRDGVSVTASSGKPEVADLTVRETGRYGLVVHAPTFSTIPARLSRVSVTASGRDTSTLAPAIYLDGVNGRWGPGGDIDGLTGGANALDGVAWSGGLTGDVVWPTVVNAATTHPLGFLPYGLTVTGNVRLPANAVIKGADEPNRIGDMLRILGSVDGTAGGTTVLPMRDTSAGVRACPSAIAAAPCTSLAHVGVDGGGSGTLALSRSSWRSASLTASRATALTLTDSTFVASSLSGTVPMSLVRDTFSDLSGVDASGSSLQVSASRFSRSALSARSTDVVVDGSTFDQTRLTSKNSASKRLTITRCSFSNADGSAVDVTGHGDGDIPSGPAFAPFVTLQDSTFTGNGTGSGAARAPAVRLEYVTASLSPTGSVARVTGSGNGIDAISVGGREVGSFAWQTPVQSATAHPLGYLVSPFLQVGAPAVVTVPRGAVVKGGPIRLEGSDLDATAGGATFTGLEDTVSGPPTCPSVLIETCTADPWNGGQIGLMPGGDAAGTVGSVRITGATLRHVSIGPADYNNSMRPRSGGSVFVAGSTGQQVTLAGSSNSLAIDASTFTGSSIGSAGSLRVTRSTIACDGPAGDCGERQLGSASSAINVSTRGPADVLIADTTIRGGGVQVLNGDTTRLTTGVRLQRLTITGAHRQTVLPAVQLAGVEVSYGPGRDVDAVGGGDNGLDAVYVTGAIAGDFTWPTLTNSAAAHPLGLVAGSLRLRGPGTVTLAPNAVVRAESLELEGIRLDGTAGGALLDYFYDSTATPPTCSTASYGCRSVGELAVVARDSSPSPSSIDLRAAHLVRTALRVNGPAGNDVRLRWSGGRGEQVTVGVSGGPLELRDLELTEASVSLTGSSGNLIDHVHMSGSSHFGGWGTSPIYAENASGTLSNSRIDGNRNNQLFYGNVIWSGYNTLTRPWTLVCDAIVDNGAGALVGGGSSVRDSNLYGAAPSADLDGDSNGPPAVAERIWWGQPGGPLPGQARGNVEVRDSAAAPQPAGSFVTSGSAKRPDGSVGPGTLTVDASFSRVMDTSVPLTVVLLGPDGRPHAVAGSWTDSRHWTGNYLVSSTSASSGANTLTVSAGRGCVPDPATNLMSPVQQRFAVAVPAPAPVPTAIDTKYAALGGAASVLGTPTGTEYAVGNGRARNYTSGRIYWSAATGAHEVHGAILTRYLALAGPTGALGFPTTDETVAGAGRATAFTGGSIQWSAATGARSLLGPLNDKFRALGGVVGLLRFPTTDQTSTPDGLGRYIVFQGGSLYWTPTTGAHEVHGLIRDRWQALGWERGRLGYPTSDEYAVSGGRRSDFQHGSITWNASTGAITVVYR